MPAKLDRCVKKIKAKQRGKKKKYNPYAVCKASIAGKTKRKRRPGYQGKKIAKFIYKNQSFLPIFVAPATIAGYQIGGPPGALVGLFGSSAYVLGAGYFLVKKEKRKKGDYSYGKKV